jgi:hypothetical protein
MGEGTSDAAGVIIGQDDVCGESVHLGEMAAKLCVACRRLLAPFTLTLDKGLTQIPCPLPAPTLELCTTNYVGPVLDSPCKFRQCQWTPRYQQAHTELFPDRQAR